MTNSKRPRSKRARRALEGRPSSRRDSARAKADVGELAPGQHVPAGAERIECGAADRPFPRNSPEWAALSVNRNALIVFKEVAGNDDVRRMTSRLSAGIDRLAVAVAREWPGIKLRVSGAYSPQTEHSAASLHYEGRAVDLNTSDRDAAKLGRLAGLAVAAKLDWVYYEDALHVHASVRRG